MAIVTIGITVVAELGPCCRRGFWKVGVDFYHSHLVMHHLVLLLVKLLINTKT